MIGYWNNREEKGHGVKGGSANKEMKQALKCLNFTMMRNYFKKNFVSTNYIIWWWKKSSLLSTNKPVQIGKGFTN